MKKQWGNVGGAEQQMDGIYDALLMNQGFEMQPNNYSFAGQQKFIMRDQLGQY